MPKTYVGGTVEIIIAQEFRINAKKNYGNNQSEALENALAYFNDAIKRGEVPKYKVESHPFVRKESY